MTEASPPLPAVTCAFGHYTQATPWADVRTLTWSELTILLTGHEAGPKEGSCIVPATFSGTRRNKADAQRIDVAFLDSDAGATLQEITAAIGARGWAAVVSSTHSHLTTRTRAKRGNWDRFRAAAAAVDEDGTPARFLETEKGYLPEIAEGALVVQEEGEYVTFEHQPCPKFRIAIPLLRPWMAAAYDDWRQANAAWKERVEALAAALRLRHDQACTDTSRLFFLPRRPADGPPPETAVLDGEPCDLFALPRAAAGKQKRPPRTRGAKPRAGGDTDGLAYADPETGEVVDLPAWARGTAGRFEIVKALQARRPEIFVGKVSDTVKHHIRCVNEDRHTNAGVDAATMIVNASGSSTAGFVYHCRHAHCDGVDRLVFLRRMLEQGWLKVADLTDARFLTGDAPSRPLIRFVAGALPEVVDQAEQALLRAKLGLYQRGAFVVRPGRVRVTVSEQQTVSTQRILEVEDHAMVEMMTQAAEWERFDGRSEAWVTMDAPLKVAMTYRQRVGRWRLPVLAGLIDAPTLRPDGSILATPGYDRATGLLLDTGDACFPAVPERPTRVEAAAALRLLDELVATFPFVDGPSRAVTLSAILTACIRRSLSTAPMHGFTAPTAGSGKSMLVDLASVISSGREAGVIAQGKTEEELEKRLGALLLAGDHVIAIDNCEAPLGGEFLCAMLTQPVVRARILGRSEAPELPANACVTATGNNLALIGDMTRRAVVCRLDPKHERPELRRFHTNPVTMVKAERGRYLVAALTVLRAYHVAGRPGQPDPLGSFDDWSGWVRGALLWLGHADPVDTIEGTRETDPKLDALTAVVTQWRAVIRGANVSVRDVIEHATTHRTATGIGSLAYPKAEYAHPDFREALLAVAGEGGAINGKRLGKWLASHQDRIVHGFRLVRAGVTHGITRWRLETARPDAGDGAP